MFKFEITILFLLFILSELILFFGLVLGLAFIFNFLPEGHYLGFLHGASSIIIYTLFRYKLKRKKPWFNK